MNAAADYDAAEQTGDEDAADPGELCTMCSRWADCDERHICGLCREEYRQLTLDERSMARREYARREWQRHRLGLD